MAKVNASHNCRAKNTDRLCTKLLIFFIFFDNTYYDNTYEADVDSRIYSNIKYRRIGLPHRHRATFTTD